MQKCSYLLIYLFITVKDGSAYNRIQKSVV